MIDLDLIASFQWDEGNARKNFDKHGVNQSESEQVFFNEPLLIVDDAKHDQTEARFHTLGVTSRGRKLHISFTLREGNSLIRVISARDMHRKEREYYDKET